MPAVFAVLDIGTSHTKAALWDADGTQRARSSAPLLPLQHKGFHVEQDLDDIQRTMYAVLTVLVQAVPPAQWASLTLICQRGTLILGDETGHTVTPMISALDRRAIQTHDHWKWWRENEPATWAKARRAWSLHSWCFEMLTGTPVDTGTTLPPQWKAGKADGLRGPVLHPVGFSAACHGRGLAADLGLPAGLTIVAGGGDKNAELAGSGCNQPGSAFLSVATSLTLGTLSAQAPTVPGLAVTPALRAPFHQVEIGLPFGGGLWDWLQRCLRIWSHEPLALPADENFWFLPHMAGSTDGPARTAAILGLTPTVSVPGLLGAALEGMVLELLRGKSAFQKASLAFDTIYLTGGGAENPALPQWVADAFGSAVGLLPDRDSGLRGGALVAAQASGGAATWEELRLHFVPDVVRWVRPMPDHRARWERRALRFAEVIAARR
jgi:xylulokinase